MLMLRTETGNVCQPVCIQWRYIGTKFNKYIHIETLCVSDLLFYNEKYINALTKAYAALELLPEIYNHTNLVKSSI